MSLVTQALVIVAAFVLENRTWAGEQIQRQPISPMGEILQGGPTQKPFLAVYAESARFDIEGRATNGREGDVELKIYVHIAPGVTITDEEIELTLDISNAGFTLDMMGRQVDHAFHIPGVWFKIWNLFVMSVKRRDVKYALYETEDGIRVPTMEITYSLKTIPDPMHGGLISGQKAWLALDAAMRDRGEETTAVANIFKELIEAEEGLPDYQALQANFGLTAGGVRASGIGPLVDGATNEDGTTPPLSEINFNTSVDVVPPKVD